MQGGSLSPFLDRLPTAKDVVAQLAINPNTVLKAYRELEREGLVAGKPGNADGQFNQPNDVAVAPDGTVVGVRTGDKGRDKSGGEKGNFEPGSDLIAKATVLCEGTQGHLTGAAIRHFGLGSEDPQRLTAYYTRLFGEPGWAGGDFRGWQLGTGYVTVGPHDQVRVVAHA